MTRSFEETWQARWIRTRGIPGPAQASTTKSESVCLTILCLSPTLLTLTGGYPHHFSLEKINLGL